jgi:UDP-N-acetylmuramyl pentapeptide phosphotransferase/UDP-N-acetylglucosamine-1-phosphate transferase
VGETVRELGLAGQNEKGTPTMGGLIIIFATGTCSSFRKITQHLYCLAHCNYTMDGDNWFYR